jgi:hypothetical protein
MEIKGNCRGWPKVPYHKPQKPLSKNRQNHQNHQQLANLMEINKNGRGCPRRTLPTTAKAIKQKTTKTAKNTSKSDGTSKEMVGDAPRGPTTNHQNH